MNYQRLHKMCKVKDNSNSPYAYIFIDNGFAVSTNGYSICKIHLEEIGFEKDIIEALNNSLIHHKVWEELFNKGAELKLNDNGVVFCYAGAIVFPLESLVNGVNTEGVKFMDYKPLFLYPKTCIATETLKVSHKQLIKTLDVFNDINNDDFSNVQITLKGNNKGFYLSSDVYTESIIFIVAK